MIDDTNEYETETTDLVTIFRQFGIYRNSLSEAHNAFVKEQLQKDYDTVTKTYELQGKTYTGTFREDSHRKENREAYAKEAKLASVLASMGFDVVLIEEDNTKQGTKPDAIVNGIVMDFKEIEAFYEKDASKNTLGNNYQNALGKKNLEGVVMYLHSFSEKFVHETMGFKKTSPKHNVMALFFHEDTGKLQLLDMQKIRATRYGQPQSIAPSATTEPHQKNNNLYSAEKSIAENENVSSPLQKIRTAHVEQSDLAGHPKRLSSDFHRKELSTSASSNPIVWSAPSASTEPTDTLTIPQSDEKSTATDNTEILTKPMTITVNDKERTCRNGVLEGFKNAVKMVDELLDENKLLKEENAELHKKLEQKSHKKDRADGWER